jgi:hypothetical protein
VTGARLHLVQCNSFTKFFYQLDSQTAYIHDLMSSSFSGTSSGEFWHFIHSQVDIVTSIASVSLQSLHLNNKRIKWHLLTDETTQ